MALAIQGCHLGWRGPKVSSASAFCFNLIKYSQDIVIYYMMGVFNIGGGRGVNIRGRGVCKYVCLAVKELKLR